MSNGQNSWGVSYVYISWLERLLRGHGNISNVVRARDIYFEVSRINQADTLYILCLDEYSMGLTMVHRAIEEFSPLNIIYVGGNWNGYTGEAEEFCRDNGMGICNASGISHMLWKDRFWE